MQRCLGCMQEYSEEFEVCPYCGYIKGSGAASRNHLEPGTFLQNRYMLGRVLGQGGFGITYIAYDSVLERPIAIKEYLANAFSARKAGQKKVFCFNSEAEEYFRMGLTRMLQESRNMAKFGEVPGVVRVFDCFEENNTAYIVMELLRGETVRTRLLREQSLSYAETMRIMQPVLSTLSQMHKAHIIHRDISPDNIFLCLDGSVKVLDFGAARVSAGDDEKSRSVMLKPGFAPKEQYSRHGKQGPWTDVYGACATMYKMLTGIQPPDSLNRMFSDTIRRISDYTEIPDYAEEAIFRGLAVEPEDRTQTMQALKEGLTAPEPVPDADPGSSEQPLTPEPAKGEAQAQRRRMQIMLIALFAAAALLIGALFCVKLVRDKKNNAAALSVNLAVPASIQCLYDTNLTIEV